MTTVSRTEAQAIGLKCFFVGEPCGRGHIAERYVGNSNCTECWREYRRRLHYRRHYGVEYGEWTGAPPPKSDHERIIELRWTSLRLSGTRSGCSLLSPPRRPHELWPQTTRTPELVTPGRGRKFSIRARTLPT